MSDYKISGACTHCDELCFEVIARWSENERYPGEPKRTGAPNADATRISFVLYDGTRCDLTFCGRCAEALNPGWYVEIWRKVMRSWVREMSKDKEPPSPGKLAWFQAEFHNGIFGEMGRVLWSNYHG